MTRQQPAKPTLDTLPAEVLDNILENLLKISEYHCHVKFLPGSPITPGRIREEQRLATLVFETDTVQTSTETAFFGYQYLCVWALDTISPWRLLQSGDRRTLRTALSDMQIDTPVTESWQYGLVLNLIDLFMTMISLSLRSAFVPATALKYEAEELLILYDSLPQRLVQQLPSGHLAKLSHVLAIVASVNPSAVIRPHEWLQMGLNYCPDDEFLAADLAAYHAGSFPGPRASDYSPGMGHVQTELRSRPLHRRTVTKINTPPWFVGWSDTRYKFGQAHIKALHREADKHLEKSRRRSV
ncbi:hypothetical protein MBLNU457_6649t1 [Dothideomycetes sp. NU457]